MKSYKIHLIRHGQTEANRLAQFAGWTDVPLSEDGRAGLLELRDSYAYPAVDRVYCSPLLRCRETAALLYPEAPGPIYLEGLKECHFGEFEGKDVEQLKERAAFQGWMLDSVNNSPPGGEPVAAFSTRCTGAFDGIVRALLSDGITSCAVVTHGGVIMNILASFALPKQNPLQWMVGNGMGYTVLVTPQLYLTGSVVEVFEPVPHGIPDVDTATQLRHYQMGRE